ncbi:MAG: UDP-N-acetylmuramate dehydrogenase [Tannerellaceae bacterium]|jgi:UDP-N-acetylmuramate dehydrogenase|nr:UDP-N-acetylmuramate dehydrogenase [Tannerellaceae bacterium]
MTIRENCSLLRYNTFRFDVAARYFVEYDSEAELERLLVDEYFNASTSLHIGRGSNLLFLGDYSGIILHSAIKGMDIDGAGDDILLRTGAGELWDDVVAFALERGWGSPENLSLIPGEVGAAAVQNIGAYGAEVKDMIYAVEAVDRHTRRMHLFPVADCGYAYRYSRFKEEASPFIITRVIFRFARTPRPCRTDYGHLADGLPANPAPMQVRDAVIRLRRDKLPDPDRLGNAGSFFMNPIVSAEAGAALQARFPDIPLYSLPSTPSSLSSPACKISAGWLIERCGLKGFRQGDAGVSERQALVLVNHGKASGQDIARLAAHVAREVYARFGVTLHPEVKYIG